MLPPFKKPFQKKIRAKKKPTEKEMGILKRFIFQKKPVILKSE